MKLQNYYILARLNSLWGAFLLMLPGLWSLTLYYDDKITAKQGLIYFTSFIGCSILMRSFGCVVNDIFDRNIDKQIKRTKKRPIAAGDINVKNAIIFALLLLILPCVVLLILPPFAQVIAILSIIPVVIYPLFKRFFSAPQLILGLTFNWGILLGSAIMQNTITLSAIYLYVAGIFWTLIYDTVYAYQDYDYDKKLGVKSLAVSLGDKNKLILILLCTPLAIFLSLVGLEEQLDITYFLIIYIACFTLLLGLLITKYKQPKSCFLFFKVNVVFSFLILLAIVFGKYTQIIKKIIFI